MIRALIFSISVALSALAANPAGAAYDIVQITPAAVGGTQTTVVAPGGPAIIPGLTASLTLANASHGVTCHWNISVQVDTAGGVVFVQLMRGGVPLGVPQVLYSSTGTMIVTLGDTVSETPGYVGPLGYAIAITPIVGQGHAPANFGSSATIVCNEVAP